MKCCFFGRGKNQITREDLLKHSREPGNSIHLQGWVWNSERGLGGEYSPLTTSPTLFPIPCSRFPVPSVPWLFPVFWCDLVTHDKDWRKYCSCMPNFSKCPLQFKAKIPVCNIRVNPLFIIHIETFGWNLHAVVLWNKFRLALHCVKWSVSWKLFELLVQGKFQEKSKGFPPLQQSKWLQWW